MKRFILFIALCPFFSCSDENKIPLGIIPPKDMSEIMWDIVRAQTLASEVARKDSSINAEERTKTLYRKVFEIHNIVSSDFDKSYEWYSSHPELLRIMFDSLYTQKQRESDRLMKEGFKSLKTDSLSRKIMKYE